MAVDISEMIKKTIVYDVLSDNEINEEFDHEFILKTLKGMVRSTLPGYKGNMIRHKGKKAYIKYLEKFYPIEKYPEKHI